MTAREGNDEVYAGMICAPRIGGVIGVRNGISNGPAFAYRLGAAVHPRTVAPHEALGGLWVREGVASAASGYAVAAHAHLREEHHKEGNPGGETGQPIQTHHIEHEGCHNVRFDGGDRCTRASQPQFGAQRPRAQRGRSVPVNAKHAPNISRRSHLACFGSSACT